MPWPVRYSSNRVSARDFSSATFSFSRGNGVESISECKMNGSQPVSHRIETVAKAHRKQPLELSVERGPDYRDYSKERESRKKNGTSGRNLYAPKAAPLHTTSTHDHTPAP